MKLFVVSDIHGHYQELLKALDEVGYDTNNQDHLLISCGDMFDRGRESMAVYEFLHHLERQGKAICIQGNHEPMFTELLKGGYRPFNYMYNGTNETWDDFLMETQAFPMYCILNDCEATVGAFKNFIEKTSREINEENPELLDWLENLPYYYETENYIFTHAAIDVKAKDWHKPRSGWKDLTWDKGTFYNEPIENTWKTVVVGHFQTGRLRKMYGVGDEEDNSILENGQKIFIDGCVALTKEVNVLVIENERLLNE